MGKMGLSTVLTVLSVVLLAAAPCSAEIQVLDGNGNVLGILMQDTGLHVGIYMPKLEKTIAINKITGDTDIVEGAVPIHGKRIPGLFGHSVRRQRLRSSFGRPETSKIYAGVQPPVARGRTFDPDGSGLENRPIGLLRE